VKSYDIYNINISDTVVINRDCRISTTYKAIQQNVI